VYPAAFENDVAGRGQAVHDEEKHDVEVEAESWRELTR